KQVVSVPLEDGNVEIKVVLESQTGTFTGSVTSDSNLDAQRRASVQATIEAIYTSLTRRVQFEISQVSVRNMGEDESKFVVVLLKTDYFIKPVGESMELFGASHITSSELEAAVRATLNATNRTISLLLK
ncbi:MAG: hypothetical protein JNN15_10115, partial [Blastocatellia bacterium]|nr:hypothetical protein [Blastocatellia bacterium]